MTTSAQFTNPAGAATTKDEMEKIRELLGVAALETRVKALEDEMRRRFDEVAARLESLRRETTAGRHAAFEELSRNVLELGERIKGLSQG